MKRIVGTKAASDAPNGPEREADAPVQPGVGAEDMADVPPAPTTFDDVLHRWAKHNPDQAVEADSELAQIITEYKELNSNIKEATAELDQLKLQICTRMEDAEMIIAEEKRLATFKYQERNTLDSKALKAAHPEIYEQFLKTSSTRVLRVS